MITNNEWVELCRKNGLVPFNNNEIDIPGTEFSFSIPQLSSITRWAWIEDNRYVIYNKDFYETDTIRAYCVYIDKKTATKTILDRELKKVMIEYKKFIKEKRLKLIEEL